MNRQLRGNLPPNEKGKREEPVSFLIITLYGVYIRTGICAGRQSFRYGYRGS